MQLQGWDKTYCLRYVEEFEEVHFFGDKTYQVRACDALWMMRQGKEGRGSLFTMRARHVGARQGSIGLAGSRQWGQGEHLKGAGFQGGAQAA